MLLDFPANYFIYYKGRNLISSPTQQCVRSNILKVTWIFILLVLSGTRSVAFDETIGGSSHCERETAVTFVTC